MPSAAAAPVDARYATTIQPLFDRRCVPCHACFDSPCQLNLQSFEGLDRGANKELVYHPDRLEAMQPMRMFEDARTSAEWRLNFDFFPVVRRSEPADVARSIREPPPIGSTFRRCGVRRCALPARLAPELRRIDPRTLAVFRK